MTIVHFQLKDRPYFRVAYVCNGCSVSYSYHRLEKSQCILRIELTYQLSKFSFFDKFSYFIVLVVFLVIVQSSELVSVWICEKMTFFPNCFSYHIFAIYVGGASLGLPTACRLIAVSGARLPSVDGLVVRCIKMHHHVKSAITICLQFI